MSVVSVTAIIALNVIVIHPFASAKATSGPQIKSATVSATVGNLAILRNRRKVQRLVQR